MKISFMSLRKLSLMCLVILLSSCGSNHAPIRGDIGFSDSRRVVIVGENVESSIAVYYQRKFECQVWFTPFQGKVINTASNLLETGIGPSRAMNALISELKSINYTVGRWEIIVPKIAEKYVLNTLKNMKTNSMAKARGMFVFIDSSGYKEIENEVKRVTADNFFVTYEFQKDISQ